MGRRRRGKIPTHARKQNDQAVTKEFLAFRTDRANRAGFPKAKWIEFCERILAEGLALTLYEARETFSKYITVRRDGRKFKVRYSNHKPIRGRELAGSCDVFVGVTHTGYRTTETAIEATLKFFGLIPPGETNGPEDTDRACGGHLGGDAGGADAAQPSPAEESPAAVERGATPGPAEAVEPAVVGSGFGAGILD